MFDLTNLEHIKNLKVAFEYSFRGPKGEDTLRFLEQYCGFWSGGPREDLNRLQYEAGKRDVILTIKTIDSAAWTPKMIAKTFERSE